MDSGRPEKTIASLRKLKYEKQASDFVRGLKAEHAFGERMTRYGIGYEKGTAGEDMHDHIDLWLKIPVDDSVVRVPVDHKTVKKIRGVQTDVYHWVELRNNKGDLGWLYGKAFWIAFEAGGYDILVERRILEELIESKLVREWCEEHAPEPFKLYSRSTWGNNDVLVLVPITDLCYIATKMFPHG